MFSTFFRFFPQNPSLHMLVQGLGLTPWTTHFRNLPADIVSVPFSPVPVFPRFPPAVWCPRNPQATILPLPACNLPFDRLPDWRNINGVKLRQSV